MRGGEQPERGGLARPGVSPARGGSAAPSNGHQPGPVYAESDLSWLPARGAGIGAAGAPPVASSVSIGDVFGLLRRRIVTLILCVILALGAAFGLLTTATKQYDATAAVKVSPIKGDSDTTINTITETRIVTSTAVAARAARALHFRGSLNDLLAQVTVSSPLNSLLIYVTYTSDRPRDAARGANAFASAYLDYRKSVGEANLNGQADAIAAKIQTLQEKLNSLGKTEPGQSSALQSQIDRLNSSLYDVNTTIVVPGQAVSVAQTPTTPSSPKKTLYLAGGLLVGLILGIAAAVVRDRRDDRLHGAPDLEKSINAPLLATVVTRTRIEDAAAVPALDADSEWRSNAEVDAYRTIATKLRTPITGLGSNIILLARGGAAKEEHTPLNLAAMFARQGIQTALVTTDRGLRHVAELFGDELLPTSLDDSLTAVPEVPNLWVLALGNEHDMDGVIGAKRTEIEVSLNLVEVALLDGVNLDLASSVLALGQLTPAAVVVAIDRRTKHAEIARTVGELAQIGTVPLGGILHVRRLPRFRGRPRKHASRRADEAELKRTRGAHQRREAAETAKAARTAKNAKTAKTAKNAKAAETAETAETAEVPAAD